MSSFLIKQILNGIAFFFILSFLQTVISEPLTKLICERETVILECSNGSLINVLTTVYGKREAKYCNTPGNTVNNCYSPTALTVTKLRCNKRQICKVPAENVHFGDPCPGIRKYLEISYECIEGGEIDSKIACENERLILQCPEEYVLRITNAVYGRLNAMTCYKSHLDISHLQCNTRTSLDVVQSKCDNRQECAVHATNDAFGGDSCPWTNKYLEVHYQCLQADWNQDSDGNKRPVNVQF